MIASGVHIVPHLRMKGDPIRSCITVNFEVVHLSRYVVRRVGSFYSIRKQIHTRYDTGLFQ